MTHLQRAIAWAIFIPTLFAQYVLSRWIKVTIAICDHVDGVPGHLALAQAVTSDLPPRLDNRHGHFVRTAIPRATDGRWIRETDIFQTIELYHQMLADNVSRAVADSSYAGLIGKLDILMAAKCREAKRLWGAPELYSLRLIRPPDEVATRGSKEIREEVAKHATEMGALLLRHAHLAPTEVTDLLEGPCGYAGVPYHHDRWDSPFHSVTEALCPTVLEGDSVSVTDAVGEAAL